MEPLKVLLVSSEVSPFAKTGGLADVAGSLPFALKALKCEVSVFLPFYRQIIKNQGFKIQLLKANLKADFGQWDPKFSLYHYRKDKIDFYFIGKDEYYNREFLYGTPSGDYPDNAVRFAFFSNAVLSSAIALKFEPDIIHCNDWQTALAPFYLKHKEQISAFFKGTKTLFTIHNLAYQGLFSREVMPEVGIGFEFFTPDTLEFYGKFNFMKSGIIYSEAVNTVSKSYAREILTQEFGCGLEGLFAVNRDKLYGILNGADYSIWNPATDNLIKTKYDKENFKGKVECKKDLLEIMKLKVLLKAPLLGVVSRLADQKGIDIIVDAAEEIVKQGCNLVVLGAGEKKYHKLLTELAGRYPQNIGVKIAFDNTLAHKIEAGCDMFLMPSRYEPGGLNQLYSLKYGTIPVVRAIGGLDDTIVDYSQSPKSGNGFKFNQASKDDLINALGRALSVYKNKKEWEELMVRAMGFDFSWEQSAKEYLKVYKRIIRGR